MPYPEEALVKILVGMLVPFLGGLGFEIKQNAVLGVVKEVPPFLGEGEGFRI